MARYARRLAVRCEQTSFFGPVHLVWLDPTDPRPVSVLPGGQERIHVEPATWLLDELSRRHHAAQPWPERVLRRHPAFRADGQALVHVPDGRRFRTGHAALQLFAA
jgi:hypothetical protein